MKVISNINHANIMNGAEILYQRSDPFNKTVFAIMEIIKNIEKAFVNLFNRIKHSL